MNALCTMQYIDTQDLFSKKPEFYNYIGSIAHKKKHILKLKWKA
jgi:hypothetical protein